MRILWADDQVEIAQTLSLCIGGPREHKISFVGDANQALSQVFDGFFDIAIIDLGMPPGQWGGLWLLEQLKQANHRLPVLVLSGEGRQGETIQALRLGARDYVTKEAAATDLKDRISAVLDGLWAEIHKDILTHFPSILAVSYKRHLSSTVPQTQMRTLIDLYENCLRLAGIIGLAELNCNHPITGGLPALSHPSMGTWSELSRALVRLLPPGSAFASLQRTLDEKNVAEIIKARNNVAHGNEWSELMAHSWLQSQTPRLREWLTRLWQQAQLRIFFVVSSEYDGLVMRNDARALEGESPVLPKFVLSSQQPLIARRAYLLQTRASSEKVIGLDPFIVLQPGNELNSWRSFTFDGWTGGRSSAVSGDESVRYIEVWSGTRSDALGPCLKAIPGFVWNR